MLPTKVHVHVEYTKKIYFVIILLGILGVAQNYAKLMYAKYRHLKIAKFSGFN